MYRIVYCDSSPIGDTQFLYTLEQSLEALNQTCLITHFSNCGQLLDALAHNPRACDLVFLDTSCGDEHRSLGVLKQLSASKLPVFLLDHAPEQGEMICTLSRPFSLHQMKSILRETLQPSTPLLLRQSGSTQTIPLNQVLYIEVFDHLLKIHTLAQQVLSVSGTLSQLQKETPEGQLLRCHKSYLVNLAHVEGIQRYRISLSDGRFLPTSKKNYNQVRQSVIRYQNGRFLNPKKETRICGT